MNLGQQQTQPKTDTELAGLIYRIAQENFPEQTSEFDKFIQEQATKYGIEYAKIKAEKGATALLRHPLFWLGIGIVGAMLIKR